MKLRLKCTQGSINFVGGRPPVVRGEIFEADETLARQLIESGDVVEVSQKKAEASIVKEATTELITQRKTKKGKGV
jgi:hypothetical protein